MGGNGARGFAHSSPTSPLPLQRQFKSTKQANVYDKHAQLDARLRNHEAVQRELAVRVQRGNVAGMLTAHWAKELQVSGASGRLRPPPPPSQVWGMGIGRSRGVHATQCDRPFREDTAAPLLLCIPSPYTPSGCLPPPTQARVMRENRLPAVPPSPWSLPFHPTPIVPSLPLPHQARAMRENRLPAVPPGVLESLSKASQAAAAKM